MKEDWKNPTCKKCGKQYRVQDIHVCKPNHGDDLFDFLKGLSKK